MVCISCILIPLALFVWHRFLQPILAALWPNLASKVEHNLENKEGQEKKCPISGKEATNGIDVSSATESKKEQ